MAFYISQLRHCSCRAHVLTIYIKSSTINLYIYLYTSMWFIVLPHEYICLSFLLVQRLTAKLIRCKPVLRSRNYLFSAPAPPVCVPYFGSGSIHWKTVSRYRLGSQPFYVPLVNCKIWPLDWPQYRYYLSISCRPFLSVIVFYALLALFIIKFSLIPAFKKSRHLHCAFHY